MWRDWYIHVQGCLWPSGGERLCKNKWEPKCRVTSPVYGLLCNTFIYIPMHVRILYMSCTSLVFCVCSVWVRVREGRPVVFNESVCVVVLQLWWVVCDLSCVQLPWTHCHVHIYTHTLWHIHTHTHTHTHTLSLSQDAATSIPIDHGLQHHDRLQNANTQLDELIDHGQHSFSSLKTQHLTLKVRQKSSTWKTTTVTTTTTTTKRV